MNNNNKKRIFIAIIFILLLFFLLAFAGGRSEVALVEFIDGFDNSVIDSQEVEIGDDAVVPEDPKHKNYVFAGWFLFEDHDIKVTDFTNIEEDLKVIALYAGDANNNGIADEDDEKFVVTFKDGLTNDVIKTESVLVGMNATAPNAPTHRGYTFIGWDKGYTNIVKNTTVTAEYERNEVAVTMYTVTFVDGDTREVIATQEVQEGKTATLPEAPKHENRVFVEWAGEYSNVKEDTTVTAIYADDMNNDGIADETQPHYDVTYKDYNGDVLDVIEDVLVDMPTPTIADPERENYTFNGWTPAVEETVKDNAEYTATYLPVNDANENGTADEEETLLVVTFVDGLTGETIGIDSVLPNLGATAPEAPKHRNYVFTGWDKKFDKVTEDLTVTAQYADDINNNGEADAEDKYFDVTFKDGLTGEQIGNVQDILIYMDATAPEAPEHAGYVFTGWDTDYTNVQSDLVVIAEYAVDVNDNDVPDENDTYYTVTFKDGLTGEQIGEVQSILTGMAATAPEAPKHRNYVFTGWDKKFDKVTENLVVTAQYADDINNNGEADAEDKYFDVTFIDGLTGEQIGEVQDVLIYMDAVAPEAPFHEGYVFTVWDTKYTYVESDLVVTAKYSKDENGNLIPDENDKYHTVTFIDGHTEEQIGEVQTILSGMAATAPDAPKHRNFVFTGWDKKFDKVTENLVVTAQYADDINNNGEADAEDKYFDVTFIDGLTGEQIGEAQEVLIYMDAVAPEAPFHEGYVFTVWDTDYTKVEKDLVVTAQYAVDANGNGEPDSEDKYFDVTFIDGLTGEQIGEAQEVLIYMDAVAPEAPFHEGYVFTEWDTKYTYVESDLVVTAKYAVDANGNEVPDAIDTYHMVTFIDGHTGKTLDTQKVLTKTAATEPAVEKHAGYVFTGWDTKFDNVTSDLTVTATYAEDVNGNGKPDENDTRYNVTYQYDENNIIDIISVLVDMPTPRIANPTKDNYYFVAWDPTIAGKVTEDAVYTAVFAPNHDENQNGIADEDEQYFTITYVDETDEGIETYYTSSVLINMPTPTIGKPTKQNYVFTGWNPEPASIVTEHATYYATWADDINGNEVPDATDTYHTVTFVDGYTGKTLDTQSVLTKTAATEPTVEVHTGYVFTGWDKKFDNVTEDLTVTAQYAVDANGNEVPDATDTYHTVTFVDGHTGKTLDTQSVLTKTAATEPTVEVHTGYVFTGWDKKFDNVTEDLTVTAQYAVDANGNEVPDETDTYHTVIFVDGLTGNTIDTQDVLTEMAATEPKAPFHEGYVFTGWNERFDYVIKDLTVTAEYAEDINGDEIPDSEQTLHEVRFYNEGVLIGNVQYVVEGEAAVAPANPTKNGYSFNGWDKSFDNIVEDLDVNATFVDDIAPTVSTSVVLSENRATATVTITATDAGTGVNEIKYVIETATKEDFEDIEALESNQFVASSNGTYTVYVSDNAGNVTIKEVEVTGIEFVPSDDEETEFTDEFVTIKMGRKSGLWPFADYSVSFNLRTDVEEGVTIKEAYYYRSRETNPGGALLGSGNAKYVEESYFTNPNSTGIVDMEANGTTSLTYTFTADTPDRFTIYVVYELDGKEYVRLYKMRLAQFINN